MKEHYVVLGGSAPRGATIEDPEVHLSVDTLLERTGVSTRRYVGVSSSGEVHADHDASEALEPFVTAVRESAKSLDIVPKARASSRLEPVHFPASDVDGQRHAVYAARLLGARVTHEVRTGLQDTKTVWTSNPGQFSQVVELTRGVEASIASKLNGSVKDSQRGSVASGLMDITVGAVQRNRRMAKKATQA